VEASTCTVKKVSISGAEVAALVTVAVGVELACGAGVAVGMGVFVGKGVGRACSVSSMAAETVPATMVSTAPVSSVGAKVGAASVVGSPGMTQAVMNIKKIKAVKNFRRLFMGLFPAQVK